MKAEDGAGVERMGVSETHRFARKAGHVPRCCATAQRYLKRIVYGNQQPGDPSAWLFEVVFDYGEHDKKTPTPDEVRTWDLRRDPFSIYRSGFEIRTYRLCRRVLMFHHMAELGAAHGPRRARDAGYSQLCARRLAARARFACLRARAALVQLRIDFVARNTDDVRASHEA